MDEKLSYLDGVLDIPSSRWWCSLFPILTVNVSLNLHYLLILMRITPMPLLRTLVALQHVRSLWQKPMQALGLQTERDWIQVGPHALQIGSHGVLLDGWVIDHKRVAHGLSYDMLCIVFVFVLINQLCLIDQFHRCDGAIVISTRRIRMLGKSKGRGMLDVRRRIGILNVSA